MRCYRARHLALDRAMNRLERGLETALDAHLNQCAACRAYLQRQQGLTFRLTRLADAAAVAGDQDRLQEHVLAAFRARHATHPASAGAVVATSPRRWVPIAAGASLVLVILGAWWMLSGAPRTATTAVETGTTAGKAAAPPRPAPGNPPHTVSISGFVPLPGTEELPAFESGAIVRVEIPLPLLPAYGIDVTPDVRDGPVVADLLVAQDGWPRAIRLAGTGSKP